jgi:two-component system chemotaxis response regulator CheY
MLGKDLAVFPADTRILIVDDADIIRQSVHEILLSMGFSQIVEAIDGNDAMAKMKDASAENKPFGLILSDWHMPNLSGLDLLRMIRVQPEWENTPFVLMTVEAELKRVTTAISAGVDQYIVKPVDGASLKKKLMLAWDKRKSG